jgi:hypothetical protein
MRIARATSMFAAVAAAVALVAGCSSGDGTAAKPPTTAASTTTTAASPTSSSTTVTGNSSADPNNTKQVCASAAAAMDLVGEKTMKNDVIVEAGKNGGNAEKAALTVFKRNMGKIATIFTQQAKVATDHDLGTGLTDLASAIKSAVGEVRTLDDLDNLDSSKARTSSKAKAAEQTLTDKCGGKFADGF